MADRLSGQSEKQFIDGYIQESPIWLENNEYDSVVDLIT